MKYYLALDQKRSKIEDKSDRFKIIDLEKITGIKINSIDGILNFTSTFANQNKLFEFLIKNNYLNIEDTSKNFCICYKSPKKNNIPGKWTKCGKSIRGQSDVLFGPDSNLCNPSILLNHLLDMQINDQTFTSYDNLKLQQKIYVNTIILFSKELINNDFYKYDDVLESAYGLLNYANNIKNNIVVDNKYFYKYVALLVEHLSFKYDKFDVNKVNPLKNKKGITYVNRRHIFEFVLYLVHIESELKKIEVLKENKNNNYENEDNIQLTLF